MRRRASSGFTLIEVLTVILILSILATIGITQFLDFSGDAKTAVTKDRINQIRLAIIGDPRLISGGVYTSPGYIIHCGGVPASLTNLVTMPGAGTCSAAYDPLTRTGWRGPYVSNSVTDWDHDAWGTALDYDGTNREISSCGPNLNCGDGDDIIMGF